MQFFSSSHSFNWVDLEYETDSEYEESDNSVAYKLLSVKPKYPNILDVKADAQQCTTTYIFPALYYDLISKKCQTTTEIKLIS